VKATNTERLTLRHCLQSRGASGWAAAVVNVELGLTLLDDLDELRECLRLMYEDTTRFDDDNDRALQARVAAALREPNDRD
jgi:hypothetical protein